MADLLLTLVAIPALAGSLWLLLLTLLSRRPRPAPPTDSRPRFWVLIPAHDEEAGIGATVASVLELDYPQDRFQVVVIADNCSDATADRAREAGAQVIERRDAEKRGKGHALALGFTRALEAGVDAAVVIDADTLVSKNLLTAFASRLAQGARAIQADYGVRNAQVSWRTRLIHLAFTLFHVLRSRGRERLGASCGLRGNGMCFSMPLLREIPYDAFSLVEDVEYGIRLAEHGICIAYADEAHVWGEMVSGAAAARSQRLRWEGGRRALARSRALPLVARSIRERSFLLFDQALDLLIPPLAQLAGYLLIGLGACGIALWLGARVNVALTLFTAGIGCLVVYVARGMMLTGSGVRGLLDLMFAPLYIIWKLIVSVRGSRQQGWVRTMREGEPR